MAALSKFQLGLILKFKKLKFDISYLLALLGWDRLAALSWNLFAGFSLSRLTLLESNK